MICIAEEKELKADLLWAMARPKSCVLGLNFAPMTFLIKK